MASVIVAQLLFLESENPKKDIWMYINSPGGVVTAGMAIHDTMQYIRPGRHRVHRSGGVDGQLPARGGRARYAHCADQCADHGAPAFGRRAGHGLGHRDSGQGNPAYSQAHERSLRQIYRASRSKEIEKAMDRDTFLEADEAKAFGLVDKVFDKRPVPTEAEGADISAIIRVR
jgi:ATP-dependent Clp protease protease subunit